MEPGPTGREPGEAPRYFTRRRIIRAGGRVTRGGLGPVRNGDPMGGEERESSGVGPGADSAAGKKLKFNLGIWDSGHVRRHMGFYFD